MSSVSLFLRIYRYTTGRHLVDCICHWETWHWSNCLDCYFLGAGRTHPHSEIKNQTRVRCSSQQIMRHGSYLWNSFVERYLFTNPWEEEFVYFPPLTPQIQISVTHNYKRNYSWYLCIPSPHVKKKNYYIRMHAVGQSKVVVESS